MSGSPWDMGYAHSADTNELPSPDDLAKRWHLTRREAALFSFGFLSRYRVFLPGFRQRAEWVYRVPDPRLDELVYLVNFHGVATDEDGQLILDVESRDGETRH